MEEHIIWWNKLTKERKQEINEIHFSCKVGEESDFDIHRAFTNLYIKQLSNHEMWWNSITHARKTKLVQTYFNFEDYGFLKDGEIQYIFNKVKNHATLVNVKPEKQFKITKLKVLTEQEKRQQERKDILTTMLALCQLLIYLFDKLSVDKSIFRHELKRTAKLFLAELERTMNVYFSLNGEEQFNQADLVNEVVFWVEHSLKVGFRAGDMDEETFKSLILDYRKFTDKYNIDNKFLETLELEMLNENNEQK